MKKIIGVVVVLAIAITVFSNANASEKYSNEVALEDLFTMNTAEACESGPFANGECTWTNRCRFGGVNKDCNIWN